MKKLMALVLAVVCVVSLFGCAAAGHENEIQTPNAPQEDLLANNGNTSSETTENPDASANVICSRIQLSYHANKDTAIMIEDTIVCSELMGYISKAAGTRGESTKGYYGAPYGLTIYVEGKEEPLGFTVWDCGQYSTSEHKDDEGYEFFFNDDISDLYKYLEEKYPDEFWYPDMEDLDTYCIGYAAKPKSPDTTTEEVTNNQELPLTIVSNEKTIIPYFHLANSKEWDGEYFVIGDGVDLSAVLDELEADGRIPRVEYSQDFDVVLGDGVTTTHILLFDETFNQLDMIGNLADLSQLDAGNYYIGIVVGQEGDYIAEANEKESVGWACVIRLTIKPTA